MRTAVFTTEAGDIVRWVLHRWPGAWIATEQDGSRRCVGATLAEATVILRDRIAPNYGMKFEQIV